MANIDDFVNNYTKQVIGNNSNIDVFVSNYTKTIAAASNSGVDDFVARYTGQTITEKKPSGIGIYISNSLKQIGQTITHPIQAVKNIAGAAVKSVKDTITNLISTKAPFEAKGQTLAEKMTTTLNAIGAWAAVPFIPITAIFAMAEQVPVLKQGADAIGVVFNVTGKIGAFVPETFIKALPISQEDKDMLAPAFGQIGALIGQVYLGGKVMGKIHSTIFPEAILKKGTTKTFIDNIKENHPELTDKLNEINIPEKPTARLLAEELKRVLSPEELTIASKTISNGLGKLKVAFKDTNSTLFENKNLKGKIQSMFKKEDVQKMVEDVRAEVETTKAETLKANPTIAPEAKIATPETTLVEKVSIDPLQVAKDVLKIKNENLFSEDPVFKKADLTQWAIGIERDLLQDRRGLMDYAAGHGTERAYPRTYVQTLLSNRLTPEEALRLSGSPSYAASISGAGLRGVDREPNLVDSLRDIQKTREARKGEIKVKENTKLMEEGQAEIKKPHIEELKAKVKVKIQDFINKNICK